MNKDLQEVQLTPEEVNVTVTGFCTIYKKKKNKAIITFNTVGEFTEDHGKIHGILGGLLGEIDEGDKEEAKKDFLDFVNDKLDKEKDSEKIEVMRKAFSNFDRDFRVLVGN